MSTVTCGAPAEGNDDHRKEWDALETSGRAFLASLPRRLRMVNARTALTREDLPARGESVDNPGLSEAAQRVWDAEKNSARTLAERYRAVASLYTYEVDDESEGDDDIDTSRAALALRVTHGVASWELRNAHQAVNYFPCTLELLESGHFPSWWFQRMLRTAQGLADESRQQIDVAIADWSTDITAERFVTLLNAFVQLMEQREKAADDTPVELVREVELAPGSSTGIGAITLRGPIPEILAYWKALDESARAVQAAQRKALLEGDSVPYDVDEIASRTGRPVPLDRLRYELQIGANLDTGDVHVPLERFRMNVTVPALTLLGASDAPGMVKGTTPIPPDMVRALAGSSKTWYRVLTDPVTGAFLPHPAQKYQPDRAMLEHLRLRNSTCALLGCTRPTSWASECDHIEEYDHRDPENGGRTEIENLHLLCWQHHLEKTLGLLDPTRLPSTGRGPGRTMWRIGSQGDHAIAADDVDFASRIAVQQLERAWEFHLARGSVGPPTAQPEPDDDQETGRDHTGSTKSRPETTGHIQDRQSAPGAHPASAPRPRRSPTRRQIPPGPWDPDGPPPF